MKQYTKNNFDRYVAKKRVGYVYVGKDKKTGDVRYVGVTKNASIRFRQHPHKDLLDFSVIESVECVATEKEFRNILSCKERYHIKKYNTLVDNNENGLNMTKGGCPYYEFSDRQKLEASKRASIQWSCPVRRKKQSIRQKKRFEDPSARKENSEKTKKYFKDNPDAVDRARQTSLKQWSCPKHRKKMSEIKKEYHRRNPHISKRHSEKMSGKFVGKDRYNSIGVECSKDGVKWLRVYESASLAASDNKISTGNGILRCCSGLQRTSGGFYWRFPSDNDWKPKPPGRSTKKPVKATKGCVFDVYQSMRSASKNMTRKHGIKFCDIKIGKAASGENNFTYNGWKFEFE